MEKCKLTVAACLAMLWLCGCTSLVVSTVIEPTASNLQKETDLDLVCDGGPAYLLMIDSLAADRPTNRAVLLTATQSYSSYTTALAACGAVERAAALSATAKNYALALLAEGLGLSAEKLYTAEELRLSLASCGRGAAPSLFWAGYGWAVWLQYQAGSPASLADLAKVEQIMLRVVELDEGYYHGAAHLFLGAYYGARPEMLGGRPAAARAQFERALALSHRHFLPAQVAFAETYARTVFDRELFVQLLQEVIDFPLASAPDCALANTIAQKRAKELLANVDQYF